MAYLQALVAEWSAGVGLHKTTVSTNRLAPPARLVRAGT
jgi:hypothetical protein